MSIDLVLCATDLSFEEGTAWRSAARLVQALNARARILHVILLEAERTAADMILVFHRHRSPLRRLLHGSVAQQVVSGARIPVVVQPIVDAGSFAATAENKAVE